MNSPTISKSAPASASYLTRLMYPLLDDADRSLLDPYNGPLGGTTSPLLQETLLIPVPITETELHPSTALEDFDASELLPTPPFNHDDFMDFMQPPGSSPFSCLAITPPPSDASTNPFPDSSEWTAKESPYPRKDGTFPNQVDMVPLERTTAANIATLSLPPTSNAQQSSTNTQDERNTMPRNIELGQTCDCFAACLHVLQSLHNHSWLLSSGQQEGPPFDVVLSINREAMDSCSTMLKCGSCVSKSGRSISTMMLATIFGKVMSLYRAACFHRFGPKTSMEATAQLAFGAYTITGENKQLLEIEILLLELRKVESILATYSRRFSEKQGEKDDETNVYNALTTYLDKNLHYIVDFLQMRKGGAAAKAWS
ncbi:hypothetical protein MMC21_007730 [Puttea exsequens]|nr:hypothetical protein [Puttea exsequens]